MVFLVFNMGTFKFDISKLNTSVRGVTFITRIVLLMIGSSLCRQLQLVLQSPKMMTACSCFHLHFLQKSLSACPDSMTIISLMNSCYLILLYILSNKFSFPSPIRGKVLLLSITGLLQTTAAKQEF